MIPLLLAAAVAGLGDAYWAGEFASVAARAPVVLRDSCFSRADSSEVLRLQGSALVALGRNREAASAFELLLDLDPDLELDPETVSPKIRAVFDGVKTRRPVAPDSGAAILVTRVDTVFRRQPVPLSIIIPGAGQLHKGQQLKGWVIIAGTAAGLAGSIYTHVRYTRARDEYLAAGPTEVVERYQEADRWYQARTISVSFTALAWLYSLVDAAVSP